MKKNNYKRLLALTLAGIISACNPIATNASKENEQTEELESELCVKATTKVNVRSLPSTNSTILGQMELGQVEKFNKELSNGWYEIEYSGRRAYVCGKYANIYSRYKEKDSDTKLAAVLKDTTITNEDYTYPVEKNEVATILDEFDNSYLINVEGNEGYINKDDVERLYDTFVIVDISDQELKLYEHNKEILSCPIVSGTPNKERHSDEGLFSINRMRENTDLIGPGYCSHVDVMMNYNKGEGLHDAQYHTDYTPSGKVASRHGWREYSEFGGETYKTNGSHGCINMPHDDALEVYKHVSLGTKVLIKK